MKSKSNRERQAEFKLKKLELGLVRCDSIWVTPERKEEFKKIAKADEEELIENFKSCTSKTSMVE